MVYPRPCDRTATALSHPAAGRSPPRPPFFSGATSMLKRFARLSSVVVLSTGVIYAEEKPKTPTPPQKEPAQKTAPAAPQQRPPVAKTESKPASTPSAKTEVKPIAVKIEVKATTQAVKVEAKPAPAKTEAKVAT